MVRHPKIEQQPVCTDRLTVSRERIRRLIERADASVVLTPTSGDDRLLYALGVSEVLEYLLDGDNLSNRLAEALAIPTVDQGRQLCRSGS